MELDWSSAWNCELSVPAPPLRVRGTLAGGFEWWSRRTLLGRKVEVPAQHQRELKLICKIGNGARRRPLLYGQTEPGSLLPVR